MKNFRKSFLVTLGLMLIFGLGCTGWQTSNAQTKPLTYPEIISTLNTKIPNKTFKNKTQLINWLIAEIKQRKVEKPLTDEREEFLRAAGATDELIEVIRGNLPTSIPSIENTPKNNSEINNNPARNSIGMEFVKVPSGSFTRGDNKGFADEQPAHLVTISKDFWMGKTEVTQGQWKAVMGNNPSHFKSCGDNCPVESVSWGDVQRFIARLNAKGEGKYRLPTEAEWEYACRAGSTAKYSFGDDISYLDEYAWYSANSGGKTQPVATKQPNKWGLYDMHGNVWEWCEDLFGNYPKGSVTDPKGTSSRPYRINRGGGWFFKAPHLRAGVRFNASPAFRGSGLGFRLIRE